MGRNSFFISVFIFFIVSLTSKVLASSITFFDKLPNRPVSETVIQDLLQQYDAELSEVRPDVDEHGYDGAKAATSTSGLEGIRDAIRRRFDLYIKQVKEVHGLQQNIYNDGVDDDDGRTGSTLRRHKRAVIMADTTLPGRRRRNITQHDAAGSQVVRVVYPLNPQPFSYQKLSDLNSIQAKGESYLFGLEVTDTGTYTCVYSVGKALKLREIARELTPGATKIEVCQIDSQIYVLPAEYNETSTDPIATGSNLFRFDATSGKFLKQQMIDTSYAAAIHFWSGTGEEANDAYLSVAPEYTVKYGKKSFDVEVSIYRWQGGYFDYVYSLRASNPQSITHAGIMSRGYLAIANYQDDSGSTSVFSEIFRYDHKESKYVSFQKIRTQGAKSIEFFGFITGEFEDHFLAIANHCEADLRGNRNYRQKSHIFKYGFDRFIPFQTFETYGAFQFLSVKMESKSFLVLGEISGIRILQYNGWKFTETYKLNLDYEALNPSLINFRPLIYGSEPYFTIASSEANIEGGVYALEFQRRNDYTEMTADLEQECRKALARVEVEDMPRLIQAVQEAPKVTDKEIVVESTTYFSGAASVKYTLSEAIIYSDVAFDAEMSIALARRSAEISSFSEELERLRDEARRVILRNEDVNIQAQIRFENVEYNGLPLKAVDVAADRLNGQRLNEVLSNLIHLNKDYGFNTVEIDSLITDQHIDVEKLNGDDISDFALKSSQTTQVFREKNKFSGTVRIESAITVDGLFDGVDLNTVDFLLKSGNQTFACDINVRESFVGDLQAELINGVNLEYYLSEGVPRTTPVRIIGGKYFETLHVSSLDVDIISGTNVNDLYEQAIRTSGKMHQTFTGRETTFEALKVKELKIVNTKLNDKFNLDDFVSISNGRYELDSVEFVQDTSVGRLQVTRSLNKIRVNDGELDLILKDSSKIQKIGNKVIDVLHLEKNSVALGLVDGVNLTNWSHEKRIHLTENQIRVGTFAPKGSLTIDEGIFIDKYGRFIFQGQDVMRYLQSSLLLNSTEIPYSFRGTIVFESIKVLGDSAIRSLNRMSPLDWLTRDADETVVVRGPKTFEGKATFRNSITADGLYYTYGSRGIFGQNEDVLKQLEDVLIDGRNQTIQRNSIFESLLVVDKLYCPGGNLFLQGIPFQHLLLVNVPQSVEARVKFLKPLRVTASFHVNSNVETARFNGYDLSTLFKDTLMIYSSHPQVFKAVVKFEGGLTVQGIQMDNVVGPYNISKLLGNVVRKDLATGQVIYGSLKFLEEASLQAGLTFTGKLNGIGHEEWGRGYLLTSSYDQQIVHTPLVFQGGLFVHNLTVANGKVSNFNVQQLANEILRIDKGGFLGTVYFTNTLIADVDSKRVNGLDLVEEVLLSSKTKSQVITAKKTFLNGFEIAGDLVVERLAGIDYNQAVKFAYGKTLPSDNLKISGNLVLRKEPFFQARFNDQEWTELLNRIWWTDEVVTIHYSHSFEVATLAAGATLEGLLSGIDLVQLENTYLSRTKDQTISAHYVFSDDLTFFDGLKVEHLVIQQGQLNGLNLEEFRDSVFLHDVDQEIQYKLSFHDLTVRNLVMTEGALVGGIDLNRDSMLVHGPNVFEREVTLESLNVANLVVGNHTQFNGVHLNEWMENSLFGYQPAEVTGVVELLRAKFTKNIQVSGLVDGIKFNEDGILTLSGDQTVQGLTSCATSIQAKDILVKTGVVNGKILQDLVDSLVLTDRGTGSILVSGEKSFLQLLKANSVVVESLFQGYNINETLGNLKPEAYLSSYFNESLEDRYKGMADLALDLHRVADRHGVFLEYFEITGSFALTQHLGAVSNVKVASYSQQTTLFVSFSKNGQSTLSWGTYFNSLALLNECSFRGNVKGFVEIEREGQVYLIVTVASGDVLQPAEALLDSKLARGRYGELEKSSGKLSRTFILKLEESASWVVYQILHGKDFGEVEAFQLYASNGHVRQCAVVLAVDDTTNGRAIILCFNPLPPEVSLKFATDNDGMDIFQVLPIVHPPTLPSLVRTLTTASKTFLAIATGEKGSEVVDIWIHYDKKFVKETCIPAVNVASLDLTETIGGQVLLAIATSMEVDENQQQGRTYIYRYIDAISKFEKIQSLHFPKVRGIQFQSFYLISTATKLLYIHTSTNVFVLSYKGYAGFVQEHIIPLPSSNFMETTASIVDGTFRAELLMASSTELVIYRAKLAGLSSFAHQPNHLGTDLVSG